MAEQTTKPHIYWADFIRVSAIFLVVVIHVSSGLLHDWGETPLSYWMSGNVYNSFARISVPLLFMISGFLLLGKRESLKDFFLKMTAKLVIPFVFWSLIYLFWHCGIGGQICSPRNISRLLLVDGTYYHLWFLYALIGLYLATPLLRLIMIFGDRTTQWYFVALWFVFQPGLMLLNELWKFRIGINVPMATGFVAFYILGYLLGEISFPSWAVIVSLLIWVLSTGATAWGTYILTSQAGKLVGFFNEYLNLTVILASISAFISIEVVIGAQAYAANHHDQVNKQYGSGQFWYLSCPRSGFGYHRRVYTLHPSQCIYWPPWMEYCSRECDHFRCLLRCSLPYATSPVY